MGTNNSVSGWVHRYHRDKSTIRPRPSTFRNACPTDGIPLTLVLGPLTLLKRDGQGGIRTLDTLASMPPFQGGAFNHSATCPEPLQGGNLVLSERKINVSLTGE